MLSPPSLLSTPDVILIVLFVGLIRLLTLTLVNVEDLKSKLLIDLLVKILVILILILGINHNT